MLQKNEWENIDLKAKKTSEREKKIKRESRIKEEKKRENHQDGEE